MCSRSTDFTPTVSNRPPSSKKNRTGLIVGIVVTVSVAAFLSVFALYYISQRRKRQKNLEHDGIIYSPYACVHLSPTCLP